MGRRKHAAKNVSVRDGDRKKLVLLVSPTSGLVRRKATKIHNAGVCSSPVSDTTIPQKMAPSQLLAAALLVLAPRSEAFLARGPLPLTAPVRPTAFRGTSAHHRHGTKALRMSAVALPEAASAGAVAAAPPVASAPSVKPPPLMYQNAVDIGEKKAAAPVFKTFLMGIISGCHIGFGALLAVTIGGNCPGLLATNPGLQKIVFGAFGEYLSTHCMVVAWRGHETELLLFVVADAMLIGRVWHRLHVFLFRYMCTAVCYGYKSGISTVAVGKNPLILFLRPWYSNPRNPQPRITQLQNSSRHMIALGTCTKRM